MKNLKIFIISTIFLFLLGTIIACEDNSGRVVRTTSASEVKDQQSLKNFVLDARNYLERDYDKAIDDFRKEDGPWRHGETYLFIIDEHRKTLLHVGSPILEGQQELLIRDLNTGNLIVDQIVSAGLKQGGDFVEYHIDDPTTEEKDTSRKITYATSFTKSPNEPILIIGAGFFPADN